MMTSNNLPDFKEVEQKRKSLSRAVTPINKEEVSAAVNDLTELVKGLSAGLTDDQLVKSLGDYGHSYGAIRAAERKLVNSGAIIGKIVPRDKYGRWEDGIKKYFWNYDFKGEIQNGK